MSERCIDLVAGVFEIPKGVDGYDTQTPTCLIKTWFKGEDTDLISTPIVGEALYIEALEGAAPTVEVVYMSPTEMRFFFTLKPTLKDESVINLLVADGWVMIDGPLADHPTDAIVPIKQTALDRMGATAERTAVSLSRDGEMNRPLKFQQFLEAALKVLDLGTVSVAVMPRSTALQVSSNILSKDGRIVYWMTFHAMPDGKVCNMNLAQSAVTPGGVAVPTALFG